VKRLLFLLAALSGVIYVGCKEGEGDRCQIDSDCKSGTCNKAEGICSTTNTSSVDAMGQPDAAPDAPDAQ
jgi:hypothetical protein